MSVLYRNTDWDRVQPEASTEPYRDDARKDFARVIHSPSFRRLQGKTQLFPGHESDFFRNRLTHSLEVGQVAESIAHRLNATYPELSENPINPRLCMTAALMHDMGHPPFGHNGEHALDDMMKKFGGFEGNAQTLRIVSCLEKKRRTEGSGHEKRLGLNLCYRSLASVLKYDSCIPKCRRVEEKLHKGYYEEEKSLVSAIKENVAPGYTGKFKTIECAIMDIADDIAYSTYDLEDSLKAGFLTPAGILSSDEELFEKVASDVSDELGRKISSADVLDIFFEIFASLVPAGATGDLVSTIDAFQRSKRIAEDGYLRTDLTAELVGEFISGAELVYNKEHPHMSAVTLKPDIKLKVECLKRYTFQATIYSTRLKVSEYRGYAVVEGIFKALSRDKGYLLLPDDVRRRYVSLSKYDEQMRVICDFIAGMTDRYALEFYGRLHSNQAESMFKPI